MDEKNRKLKAMWAERARDPKQYILYGMKSRGKENPREYKTETVQEYLKRGGKITKLRPSSEEIFESLRKSTKGQVI